MNPFNRLYGVEHMVRPEVRRGELPGTKEAYRTILQIALPSVAEMVLMSLIGSVDTMMVGSLGSEAIAAVGLPGQPRMLMLAIFFALNVGVTAIVARRRGQERPEEANRTFRNALILILALSVVMTIVAEAFAQPLMRLAGGTDVTEKEAKVLGDATTYFRILMLALPLNALTLCINAAQRGIGNTRITMMVNIISNLVNVVFNYLLIGGNLGFPRLEVAGAALASVIGVFVGFVLAVVSVATRRHKAGFLHISRRDDWHLDRESLGGIVKVGGNAMLEQAALRIGFFIYARMVYSLGADAFASHQIVMQFMNLSFTFGDGFGVAGTSLVGQMLGRKRPDLSMMYGKASQRLALTAAFVLLALIIPLRYQLVGLFIGPEEPHVAQLAAEVMVVLAVLLPFQTSSVVISGCLRGAGDTRYVAVVMMACVMLLRPAFTGLAIFALKLGLIGAWASSAVDMIVRLTCVYIRFHKGKWMSIRI